MPQPLDFRSKIAGWVGGREGALARTREMLATTHPAASPTDSPYNK